MKLRKIKLVREFDGSLAIQVQSNVWLSPHIHMLNYGGSSISF